MNNIFDKKYKELQLFIELRKEVEKTFLQENSASSQDISQWKGLDIVNFQEHLHIKTKARVSEKWFYTHFKSKGEKLPRIDMLNLLSEYCGYQNWADYLKQKDRNIEKEELEDNQKKRIKKSKSNRKWRIRILAISFFTLLFGITYHYLWHNRIIESWSSKEYKFCFIDADSNETIKKPVEITIKEKDFVPKHGITDTGCFAFKSKNDTVQLIVKSTFYKRDTFQIRLNLYQNSENIELIPDDYKVMLYYYSRNNVDKRIEKLKDIIASDARIYRIYDEKFGREILTRDEYIALLSLPLTSLENFILIQSEKDIKGKINFIKFRVNEKEK